LEERISLFQELQHRVKNTLTTINSFVDLELARCECEEAHEALSRLRSRTETLSSLYLLLHKSGSTNLVDAGAYLASLMSTLLKGYASSECKISLQAEYIDVQISAKEASALGLLVTELVTNSFKYAFEGRDSGTVFCLMNKLSKEKGSVELIVGDDGAGMDREVFNKTTNGLGLVLAKQLASQLGGTLELLQTDGAMFRFVLYPSKE
jgi:two-component sensor histidine kinase